MRVFVELDVEDSLLSELVARHRTHVVPRPVTKTEPPPPTADKRWLHVKEAAAYASVSPKALYAACRTGQLRHARVGGNRSVRLLKEWIDQWLEASKR